MARKNVTLLTNKENRLNDVRVVLSGSEPGEGSNTLYVTFFTKDTAFNDKTGNKAEVRDRLADILQARMQSKGLETDRRVADGYITLHPKGSTKVDMVKEADEAMKGISTLTDRGVSLKAALQQVLDVEKAAASGKPRPEIRVKARLDKDAAKAAVLDTAKLVMPATAAASFADTLANNVVTKFPTRPQLDEPNNSSTEKDPLYKLVQDACGVVDEDKGKRRYATGAIFDALIAAYDGLGKAANCRGC